MKRLFECGSLWIVTILLLLGSSAVHGLDDSRIPSSFAIADDGNDAKASTVILYVDPQNANCEENSGAGSEQFPFCTIARAYYFAPDGAQIRVKPGVYDSCLFLYDLSTQKTVHVFADAWVNNGDNTATVIDGTRVRDCVYPQNGFDAAVVNIGGHGSEFVGFTVRGGRSSGIFGIGSVAITNNLISDNLGPYFGGGIYFYTGNCYYGDTTTTIRDNTITENVASGGSYVAVGGGGISITAGLRDLVNGFDPSACPLGGNATVVVQGNSITNNSADGNGGGIFLTSFTGATRSANIVITQNVISGNSAASTAAAGYGGGVYGMAYGLGSEQIEVSDNTITGNRSQRGLGGGLSLAATPAFAAPTVAHEILVQGNQISGNTAGRGGGGMNLRATPFSEVSPTRLGVIARDNEVTGNLVVTEDPLTDPLGGGGILANFESFGVRSSALEFGIIGNRVSDNRADGFGGGLSLFSLAEAAPFQVTGEGEAEVLVVLRGNWITGNRAESERIEASGSGVFAYLAARGSATSIADLSLNTIASNTLDNVSGTGGIHIESLTRFDSANAEDGRVIVSLNSSIVAENDGTGIGGPVPGATGLITTGGTAELDLDQISHNDVVGNGGGDYAPWVGDRTGLLGNISQDPLFVDPPNDVHLRRSSPAIESGDPLLSVAPDELDIDGDTRVLDGNGDNRATVDMGCDEYLSQVVNVRIDIKPESYPNSINPCSRGVIPVAILGGEDFNVAAIDVTTLAFGPGGAQIAHFKGHLQDVNSDGTVDLLLHFRTQDTGIARGDGLATLTGEKLDGTLFEGADSIQTVGCHLTRRPIIWIEDPDKPDSDRSNGPVDIERK